ncbi:MAG TPA: aminotransferase class III-fold pyridoxal phosphate-dependent enzyme [Actinomycetota bacterium]|nr:aminotransferase class III-fold pyridoxal phosphate-dependent enzyme [Actinomycetota bacterium]
MSSFWHPFADMAAVDANGALTLIRGEGSHVWDADGTRYLDATGGLWFCNVGHGRAEIAEAAARQMRDLAAYHTFGDLTNPPTEALADRVASIAPVANSRVFLTSGGSDSVDTATKIVRRYWSLLGQPERTVLIRRERAYHGMHTAGTSLAGIPANLEGFGGLLPDVAEVAWDDANALRETIETLGPDRVAAFFCEPVIGAGGVFPPPEGYLAGVRQVCREAGVLFVADEVITGFGRCGSWFASGRFGLEPDLITCAKGITSGYLPLGAVIASPLVWEPFWRPGAGLFRHGYTYTGHATVSAVALANLDVMEREDLVDHAKALEEELATALAPLASHPSVSEVRSGTGVLAAVQLADDVLARDPGAPARLMLAARRHGVMSRALAPGALQVSPPLILEAAELRELASGLDAALTDLEAGR